MNYKAAKLLDQLPPRYQIHLPDNDPLQYVPLLATPPSFVACSALSFKVDAIDNGPSVVFNVSRKPIFIHVAAGLGPYAITGGRMPNVHSIGYARYRRLVINSNAWPEFTVAYREHEFNHVEPIFTLTLTVQIAAPNLDEAIRKAREHTKFLKFDRLTIEHKQ